MGWNQCYCKVYQILIPMTIHRLKSVLEWSRCPENRDNVPIEAPLTFESHNFWPDCWIFKIHTFSETESQDLSRHVKIKPIRGSLKVAALELPPWNLCHSYKKPEAPFSYGRIIFFSWVLLFSWFFYTFFPSLKYKKHLKNTSKLLDSSLFTKNTRYCSYTQSSSPWFYILDLGFRGVDIAF